MVKRQFVGVTVCRHAACVLPSRFVKVIGVTLVVSQAIPMPARVKVIGVSHPLVVAVRPPLARAATSPCFSFSGVTLGPWTLHAYTVGSSHWTDAVS